MPRNINNCEECQRDGFLVVGTYRGRRVCYDCFPGRCSLCAGPNHSGRLAGKDICHTCERSLTSPPDAEDVAVAMAAVTLPVPDNRVYRVDYADGRPSEVIHNRAIDPEEPTPASGHGVTTREQSRGMASGHGGGMFGGGGGGAHVVVINSPTVQNPPVPLGMPTPRFNEDPGDNSPFQEAITQAIAESGMSLQPSPTARSAEANPDQIEVNWSQLQHHAAANERVRAWIATACDEEAAGERADTSAFAEVIERALNINIGTVPARAPEVWQEFSLPEEAPVMAAERRRLQVHDLRNLRDRVERLYQLSLAALTPPSRFVPAEITTHGITPDVNIAAMGLALEEAGIPSQRKCIQGDCRLARAPGHAFCAGHYAEIR